jgi:hypothetical protein
VNLFSVSECILTHHYATPLPSACGVRRKKERKAFDRFFFLDFSPSVSPLSAASLTKIARWTAGNISDKPSQVYAEHSR